MDFGNYGLLVINTRAVKSFNFVRTRYGCRIDFLHISTWRKFHSLNLSENCAAEFPELLQTFIIYDLRRDFNTALSLIHAAISPYHCHHCDGSRGNAMHQGVGKSKAVNFSVSQRQWNAPNLSKSRRHTMLKMKSTSKISVRKKS